MDSALFSLVAEKGDIMADRNDKFKWDVGDVVITPPKKKTTKASKAKVLKNKSK